MVYSKEMAFLHDLSRRAGAELMQRFGTKLNIRHKSDQSLVTDADLASERVILETIGREFPQHLIYSEEAGLSSESRTPGQSIWVIDPLDGTTNFANRYPFFAVSIARAVFQDDGSLLVEVGVVHDPVQDRTYVAARNQGAYRNGTRIKVIEDRAMSDAFLVTGFAYHSGEHLRRGIDFFHAVAETGSSIRRDGAAALDLALVAEGVYDGYWESGLGPWDLAAGSLLVEEAKGRIQNFSSRPAKYSIEQGNIVCGTPSVVTFLSNLLVSRGQIP